MPDIFGVVLDFDKLDSKQVLIYVQDCRNNNRHREIFFHDRFVEIECLLDIDAVIVPDTTW